ncbi:hypothetical protein BVRB_026280 [Beta vulgaris subsp. vulgaris]|uniref:Uncharacterized protein n=1 Tax=Beta vulgaris subsp. vulgaris TaxID=3555 RepID=A0A0J8B251_BETVV|nr:hypothetical protein BVRB_026280 [Beta vulgaris subsp. vulgaris]
MTTVRPLINCSFKVPCNDRQGSTSINSQLRNCLAGTEHGIGG